MKALLIHWFEGRWHTEFMLKLKGELEEKWYTVLNPTLPNPDCPDYKESLDFLKEIAKNFWKNDVILGHSLGGKFALKLLEESEIEVRKCLILAPVTHNNLDFEYIRNNWKWSDVDSLERVTKIEIDLKKISSKAEEKHIVLSSDDPYIPLSTGEPFADWNISIFSEKWHYTWEYYPELTEILIK